MPHTTRTHLIATSAAFLMANSTVPAQAQAFADLKLGPVDYSKSEMAPRKTWRSARASTFPPKSA